MEIRPIPRFAPYEVSENGQVYRRKTDGSLRPLKNSVANHGYYVVNLKGAPATVHSLVASTFIGPRPKGTVVCHNNGVKTDNRVANLRYDTYVSNESDKHRHGTANTGEYGSNAILTGVQVEEIRREIATNYRIGLQKSLAQEYGVSEQIICDIKKKRRWKDGYRTRRVQANPEEAATVSATPRQFLQHEVVGTCFAG